MKKLGLALLVVLFIFTHAALVFGEVDPVFEPDSPERTQAVQVEVRDLLDKYLKEQGWVEGPNQHNGQTIFVSTGIGVIHAPAASPEIVDARVNAYDIAMLRAKQDMTEHMGQTIETEAVLAYSEGNLRKLDSLGAVNSETPTILDKVGMLLHASLDAQLAKRSSHSKMEPEEIKKVARASEEFQRLTRILGQATINGLQAYKVIEHIPSQGQGQIGVVAIYSPRLARMAFALASGTPVPETTPRQPLLEQIPADTDVLMSSFGVSQRINENGEFVLVAFGQARPATSSTQSRLMAERRARAQALGALRSFAGESVHLVYDLLEAQTVQEYVNMTSSYANESAYRETIQTSADAMQISGVDLLRRWNTKHPATGTDIVGVVLTWSPSQHAQAQSFRQGMRREADQSVNQPLQPNTSGGGMTREGLSGDPDGI